MDRERRKALLEAYENRIPEMGIIALHIPAENLSFINISKDIQADFNSNLFKLSCNSHPNKVLQGFYKQHGKEGLVSEVLEQIEVKDPKADYTDKLEAILEKLLNENSNMRRIWR